MKRKYESLAYHIGGDSLVITIPDPTGDVVILDDIGGKVSVAQDEILELIEALHEIHRDQQ